ncbi:MULTISPECIES: hypothetical protein [Photorhabdus]|uniref:hypothetical protein n=1 Tax=Photorhabdus TaxID=29487 RepID=UPI001CA9CA6E|nr:MULTISPECIES: hypothetical protein [Photorhabdus]
MNTKIVVPLCLVIFFVKLYLDAILFPGFTVDSWTYYDLSKVVFTGYEPSFIRQYQYNSLHSPSFPFFYPLLIGFMDNILNIGIYSSVILNIILLSLCAILSAKLLQRLRLQRVYFIVFAFLLLYPPFFQEVVYGRAIPLATLELLLIGYIFLSQQHLNNNKLLLLGFVFGLSILTRFEFLIIFLIFNLWVAFKEKTSIGKLLFMIFPLISIVIWTFYSEYYFNTLWVTENSKLLVMPPHISILDYKPNLEENTYLEIIKNIITKELRTITAFTVWGVFTPLPIIFFYLTFKKISKKTNASSIKINSQKNNKLAFFILAIISVVPVIGLTGYTDGRYFFNVYLFIIIFLLNIMKGNINKHNKVKIVKICLIYIILISSAWTIGRTMKKTTADNNTPEYISEIDRQGIAKCITTRNIKRILFITKNGFEQVSVSENAINSKALFFLSPSNIDSNNIDDFVKQHAIDAIYTKEPILMHSNTTQCNNNLYILIK